MPREYSKSEKIEAIAKPLVKAHHDHLLGAKIAYVMKEVVDEQKPMKPGRAGKHAKVAKARKVSDLYLLLCGFDFILEVDEFYFNFLGPEQQEALIDHELCHMAQDEDGFYIREHEVEEFRAVLERHGFWRTGLEEFVAAAQPFLPFDDGGKGAEASGVH